MTDAEILQSRIDHFWAREEIMHVVQSNTPTRWRRIDKSGRRTSIVFDYAEDKITVCRW